MPPDPELDLEGLLPDEEEMPAAEPGGGDELPPGFMSAFEEYEAAEPGSEERARAFYSAIKACEGM